MHNIYLPLVFEYSVRRGLAASIQLSFEAAQRYLLCTIAKHYSSNMQVYFSCIARSGISLKPIQHLITYPTNDMAAKTNANNKMMARIRRYVVCRNARKDYKKDREDNRTTYEKDMALDFISKANR